MNYLSSTPEKQIQTASMVQAPSSAVFTFDTSSSQRKQEKITFSTVKPTATLNQSPTINNNFYKEVEILRERLYSTSLSNNVLSEFDKRYQQAKETSSIHTNVTNSSDKQDQINRNLFGIGGNANSNSCTGLAVQKPMQSRAKAKFNRMESISSHYAARRKEQQKLEKEHQAAVANRLASISPVRKVIETEKKTPIRSMYSDDGKRSAMKDISSSKKRMRKLDGSFKEMNELESPTHGFSLLTSESKLITDPSTVNKYISQIKDDNYSNTKLDTFHLPPPPQLQFEKKSATQEQPPTSSFTSISSSKSTSTSPLQRSRGFNNNLHKQLEKPSKTATLNATSLSDKTNIPVLSNRQVPSFASSTASSSIRARSSGLPQPTSNTGPLNKSGLMKSSTMQDLSPSRLNSRANSNVNINASFNTSTKIPLTKSYLTSFSKENYNPNKAISGKSGLPLSTSSMSMSRSATASNIPILKGSNLSSTRQTQQQARPSWRI